MKEKLDKALECFKKKIGMERLIHSLRLLRLNLKMPKFITTWDYAMQILVMMKI